MKRSYLNLALLLVAGGLGAALWFGQKKEEKGPPLTSLKQESITRIALEHPGKPVIRLEKKGDAWLLTEPVKSETDKYEIGGILSLADLELKSKLDKASVDRKELELDPPKYSVILDDTRIDIGGTEPIKYRRYVSSGDVTGLIDDPPSAALDADYADLVSKSLLPEGANLRRIELPGLTLEKSAEGAWTSPQQRASAPAQVAQLAESWRNAKAMWNAAEPAEGSAGDAVRLTLDDGRAIDLVVVTRDPQLVLSSKALRVRYTLSKALVDELFRIPAPPPPTEAPAAPAPAEKPLAPPATD
ncbi:MAG: DUF4340 domain-containing protein [Panacagrimonas sp.]